MASKSIMPMGVPQRHLSPQTHQVKVNRQKGKLSQRAEVSPRMQQVESPIANQFVSPNVSPTDLNFQPSKELYKKL